MMQDFGARAAFSVEQSYGLNDIAVAPMEVLVEHLGAVESGGQGLAVWRKGERADRLPAVSGEASLPHGKTEGAGRNDKKGGASFTSTGVIEQGHSAVLWDWRANNSSIAETTYLVAVLRPPVLGRRHATGQGC